MRDAIKRNWEAFGVVFAVLVLLMLRMYQHMTGHEILTPNQAIVVIALLGLCYVCAVLFRKAGDEVNQVLAMQGLLKHEPVTTIDSATRDHPQSLPEHQDTRVLFSSRQLGKTWLLQRVIDCMRHQHLILVHDAADLQTMTTERARQLDHKTARVLTAARTRNIIMGNDQAHHIVMCPAVFPELLRGVVFETIEVSPTLKGREPAWVTDFLSINQLKLDGRHCSYPRCNCPADHPGIEGWCMRGLPAGEAR